ncbi:GNAT family N-acetyltransferase [Komarekiella sp. 'clone 1']|uniref:GNAT family N-acetyltransferase n=1 Tax=Komarekiella delphini-convector SJRDD-AB1 TaxID=2593771 RepID=A0AA40T1T3_9NOST|nr:GNAT family N-acetyltransferase [Komarekiella delphini-convector]MBD6619042.1 GNAT family N-acetyltransferase [Komarekiella delphini-convector SJRDD-AB1]
MKAHQFQDASQFYAQVKDYLLSQEALHNLLLALSNALIQNPERFKEKPYLATVDADGDIVAVALRTPPRNLVLSQIKDLQAVEVLAQDLYLSCNSLPGIMAPIDEAQVFALVWRSLTSQSYEMKMTLRTFKLEKVQMIASTTGYLRQATEGDKELLKNWNEAFALEALGKIETDPEHWAERVLQQGYAYLWQDEVPVSIACRGSFTPNGVRVNMVYTPPEYRRKGYASACVAALSQTLLNQGNRFCFLFTDLANPTSNHIYQKIGYQPVGDWQQYSFV